MNVMRSRLNSQSGFSLVELMVVVAIIGILAAVAIPQFSKFQARTRQSEAKAHLSGIYTAQKGFQAEFSQYYGGLRVIGYSPDGGATGSTNFLRYNAGFTATNAPPPQVTPPAQNPLALNLPSACTNGAGVPVDCQHDPLAFANLGLPAGSTAAAANFTAGASGNPNAAAAAGADQWTINELKSLNWSQNGIN